METKLYVGNLPFSTTEDELRDLFTQAGTVASVELIKDRFTGSSKGFAFVQMSTQAEAEKAINMFNGYKIANRDLKVNPARPREEGGGRRPGGSGFGGPRRSDGGGFDRRPGGPGGGGNRRGGPGGTGGTRRY